MVVKRFSIWWVNLNPTQGSEQKGHRPVLVVSPDEMNQNLRTVIVAPMTTKKRHWPTRIPIEHQGQSGEIALDQIRALDKIRLESSFGQLDSEYHSHIIVKLLEIFSE